jgi:hypothetical protein
VQEVGPATGPPYKRQQAEKDLRIADFYRLNGHPDSARFYYKLVERRYPDTPHSRAAALNLRLMDEQAKPAFKTPDRKPARVGQVLIVGNTRTPDTVILKAVPLFPGQVLSYADLRAAERKLARLNRFKVDAKSGAGPTVSVLDRGTDEEYRDILIRVEEE